MYPIHIVYTVPCGGCRVGNALPVPEPVRHRPLTLENHFADISTVEPPPEYSLLLARLYRLIIIAPLCPP